MPPAIIAVAAMAASYGVASSVGIASFLGMTAMSAGMMFLGGLVGMAVSMAGAALIGQPTPPSVAALDYARGILLNRASNASAIPVIYGRRRVGCSRVFIAVTNRPEEKVWVESGYWDYLGSGDDAGWVDTSGWVITSPAVTNGHLHLVLVLGEGPVSSINEVYFNDIPSTDARFAGHVTIKKHLGADDQAADSDLMAACPEWTADHRLRGVAYVYLRLRYNQSVFPAGLPNITVDVDGRTVYDPRDAQTKWTRNPALCCRDYLINTRYGRGIPAAMIHDAAISAAANYCDELVTVGGVQQARYTCDGVINVDDSALENTNNLLTSCRGMLIFSGGLYRLLIDKPEAATFDFDEDNITGAWTISLGSKRNMYNRIRARFFNPAKSWQEDIAPIDSAALRALDNGLVLETSVYLPFTADINTAKQITTINLNQSRQQIACQFTAFIKGLRCEVGDVARITHSTPGWSAKKFRVLNMALKNNDEVTVTAREYADAVYDFGTILASDPAPNTNLPALGTVAPPVNLAASERLYWTGPDLLSQVTIAWESPPDAFVASYDIECKVAASDLWLAVTNTKARHVVIGDLHPGPHNFRVRSINTLGAASGWAAINYSVLGKTALPGNVGAITAVPWEDGATFSWPKVGDLDLAGYRVRTGVHWQPSTSYQMDFGVVPTGGAAKLYKCTTAGVSGASEPAWNTSPITDGSAIWTDVTAGWLWETIAEPSVARELTDAEMSLQGWGALTLRIWALAVDTSGNLSATAATAATAVLNQKPYITVGVTSTYGTFTDLAAAIARLPSGGGAIIIKNGVYQMTDEIVIPDKNLDISGESQGGVVVRNYPGKDLFKFSGFTKKLKFFSFSVHSQNIAAFGKMFSQPSSATVSPGKIDIEEISFILAGGGAYGADGDQAINLNKFSGEANVRRCSSVAGKGFFTAYDNTYPWTAIFRAEENIVSGNSLLGIYLNGNNLSFKKNILTEQAYGGIACQSLGEACEILDNTIVSRTDANICAYFAGVNFVYNNGMIRGNKVRLISSAVFTGGSNCSYGIRITGTSGRININENIIEANLSNDFGITGLSLTSLSQSDVSGNIIKITNGAASYGFLNRGIGFWHGGSGGAADNTLSNNNIILSDGNRGYGIYMDNLCSGQKGINNIITGAGIKISDNGTGNTINKSAGGTF